MQSSLQRREIRGGGGSEFQQGKRARMDGSDDDELFANFDVDAVVKAHNAKQAEETRRLSGGGAPSESELKALANRYYGFEKVSRQVTTDKWEW